MHGPQQNNRIKHHLGNRLDKNGVISHKAQMIKLTADTLWPHTQHRRPVCEEHEHEGHAEGCQRFAGNTAFWEASEDAVTESWLH